MKTYKFKLAADTGIHYLSVASDNILTAMHLIMKAENCPEGAIKSIHVSEFKGTERVRKQKEQWEVLSPDGITISGEQPFYNSEELAKESLREWINRYSSQGYYRDNNWEKIPLTRLFSRCTITQIK